MLSQLFHSAFRKKVKSLSHVILFVTPWTVTHQAPPSMEFSRQEYWSGLPLPSPGDLPNPGVEPESSALQADSYCLSQGSPVNPMQLAKKLLVLLNINKNVFKWKETYRLHFWLPGGKG